MTDGPSPSSVAPSRFSTATTSFFAPAPRRESGCPVHFVWDGTGLGRPLVRLGFLLVLGAGGAGSFALMTHGTMMPARVLGAVALGLWTAGQVFGVVLRQREKRARPEVSAPQPSESSERLARSLAP
jgi:hypothetical protein